MCSVLLVIELFLVLNVGMVACRNMSLWYHMHVSIVIFADRWRTISFMDGLRLDLSLHWQPAMDGSLLFEIVIYVGRCVFTVVFRRDYY